MFTLELDLIVQFCPPMTTHGAGLVFTRVLQLPFPPFIGLAVYGRSIDEAPEPQGFAIQNLTWDIDREVFLGTASIEHSDVPFVLIPEIIRSLLDRGWQPGSASDAYVPSEFHETNENPYCDAEPLDVTEPESKWHTITPNRRPKAINRVFKALVRRLVETYDNEDVAYAIDQGGVFIEEPLVRGTAPLTSQLRAWYDLKDALSQLSPAERERWRARTRRYPDLVDLARRASTPEP